MIDFKLSNASVAIVLRTQLVPGVEDLALLTKVRSKRLSCFLPHFWYFSDESTQVKSDLVYAQCTDTFMVV